MKRFEKIFGVVFVIGLILRLVLISGAYILISIASIALVCFYWFFGFAFFNDIKLKNIFNKKSYKGISVLRIIGSIVTGWTLSIICFGIFVKMQPSYLPGVMMVLLIGLIMIFVITCSVLYQFFRSKSIFYKKILLRLVIIGGLGVLLFVTPDLTIAKFLHRDNHDYIKKLERHLDNPQNEEARKQLEIEYNKTSLNLTQEEYEEYEKYLQKNR